MKKKSIAVVLLCKSKIAHFKHSLAIGGQIIDKFFLIISGILAGTISNPDNGNNFAFMDDRAIQMGPNSDMTFLFLRSIKIKKLIRMIKNKSKQ